VRWLARPQPSSKEGDHAQVPDRGVLHQRRRQSAGGSTRREAVSEALASVGGSLESFHFGFGDADAYVIAELPDNESAAAVALSVNASGGAVTKTIVLLTPEEVDAAAQKSVGYRTPGS
jgi:uncharacterized protein with GYD domain